MLPLPRTRAHLNALHGIQPPRVADAAPVFRAGHRVQDEGWRHLCPLLLLAQATSLRGCRRAMQSPVQQAHVNGRVASMKDGGLLLRRCNL